MLSYFLCLQAERQDPCLYQQQLTARRETLSCLPRSRTELKAGSNSPNTLHGPPRSSWPSLPPSHWRRAASGLRAFCPVVFMNTKWSGAQLGSLEDNKKLGGMATGAQDWRERLIKALEDDIPMALELVQCHSRPDRLPGTADPGLGACLLPSLHSALYSELPFSWKRKIGSIRVPCRQSNSLSLPFLFCTGS